MKYTDEDDETLVLLTLAGDESAYERLVIKHQKAVIAAAAAVTHSYGLAEDAAQDAFVTAWMKLNLLKETEKFRNWVCRIAENCARRMLYRLRDYVPIDDLSEYLPDISTHANPAYVYEMQEETAALRRSIEKLPERVQLIIRMYYMEGKTVDKIAEQLGVSIGTVKSQLFDGRQKLRKDLEAMNEQKNDTLAERVIKKVEVLKKWQYKSEKVGFETVYRDVLHNVEELPESRQKNSALADVLMKGYWWIPGENNDEIFKQIKETAIEGKNEEVMSFAVETESAKIGGWGKKRAKWLRNTAIPELEKNGFRTAIGDAWILIANACDNYSADYETELLAACKKAEEYLPENTLNACICAEIPQALNLAKEYRASRLPYNRYWVDINAAELHIENGNPMFWKDRTFYISGELEACDNRACDFFSRAAKCDGYFTVPGLKVGENYREKLYYTEDKAEVNTPAGTFAGCQVWTYTENFQRYVTYYKEDTGIVRQDAFFDGFRTTYLLSEYSVKGGGLLPLNPGNRWHYINEQGNSSLKSELEFTVNSKEDGIALISGCVGISRGEYNENSWEDMAQAIANEYYIQGNGQVVEIRDMSHYISRAETLAVTPAQKAHTSAAASVMHRIMDGEPSLYPGTHIHPLRNFFNRAVIKRKDGVLAFSDGNSRWSFELKGNDGSLSMQVLARNFIYGILQDNALALWNDAWTDGYTEEMLINDSGDCILTKLACTACKEVSVPAGTFRDCLKVTLDVSGHDSCKYQNGVHEYIFAPGTGLISVSASISGVSDKSVYLLTAYSGTGEGYMPVGDGFFRRYEAQNLTDGYVAWTEYSIAKSDEEDALLLFSNQCGYREEPQDNGSDSSI